NTQRCLPDFFRLFLFRQSEATNLQKNHITKEMKSTQAREKEKKKEERKKAPCHTGQNMRSKNRPTDY
ncbi:hypothetical protein OFB58_25875, partial [Escherichia coli]|nr:hypothetical protein [Escherichia coli]